jgi:hypothetical protein
MHCFARNTPLTYGLLLLPGGTKASFANDSCVRPVCCTIGAVTISFIIELDRMEY